MAETKEAPKIKVRSAEESIANAQALFERCSK
jgi:hypothetical protein